MKEATCPTCAQRLVSSGKGRPTTFPFCSTRCRDVDLGRWFSEQYSVPVETQRVMEEAIEEEGLEEG